jgi:hypothetical protein
MATPSPFSFWFLNRVANPVLRRVLRTPLGRRPGRRLAVLRYRGRTTAQPHELVVMYVRMADTVWIMVGWPETKRWWRNLVEAAPVELWIGSRHVNGSATVLTPGVRDDERRAAFAAYTTVFPKAPGPAADAVMVQVVLDGEA